MGRFLIFLFLILVFGIMGLTFWRIWNKIYIRIRRDNKAFEVESEAYEKMKEKVKEENKDE